jgi:dihydrofolate synthase/folylpolyglutamate synthase
VITTLGLDHTAILGETIEEIAAEKAGIIKPGRPVVIARQAPEFAERVVPVLRRKAEEVQAPMHLAWEECPVLHANETPAGQDIEFALPDGSLHSAHLPLHGDFQRSNLEAALAATWLVLHTEGLRTVSKTGVGNCLAQGISACHWPGRMEITLAPSGQALVLDGAHCPLSAKAAARTVSSWQDGAILPRGGPIEVLWGMQRDKDHRAFLEALVQNTSPGLLGAIHTYRVTGVRGAEAELLAQVARESGLEAQAHASPEAALDAAAKSGRNVLAIGTLYTLAGLRKHWEQPQLPDDQSLQPPRQVAPAGHQ